MINLGKDSSKMELRPERDWRLVVLTFFVLLVGLTIFHYYLFVGYSQRKPLVESQSQEELVGPDHKLLEKVIGSFEAKEKKMRQHLDNEIIVSDPAR